jgi:polyphosphate glucokinase
MVELVKEMAADWEYDAISIGYPGLVGHHIHSEPGNLGAGWVGFDFPAAFGRPVRIFNDAAMQALGSYEGGRMLFLGLGTGLGSALIAGGAIVCLELGQLPHTSGDNLGKVLGRKGLDRLGKDKWIEAVKQAVEYLRVAFIAEHVVIGGGNAKKLKNLLPGTRLGHNLTSFRGGMRLWNTDLVPTHSTEGEAPVTPKPAVEWRLL